MASFFSFTLPAPLTLEAKYLNSRGKFSPALGHFSCEWNCARENQKNPLPKKNRPPTEKGLRTKFGLLRKKTFFLYFCSAENACCSEAVWKATDEPKSRNSKRSATVSRAPLWTFSSIRALSLSHWRRLSFSPTDRLSRVRNEPAAREREENPATREQWHWSNEPAKLAGEPPKSSREKLFHRNGLKVASHFNSAPHNCFKLDFPPQNPQSPPPNHDAPFWKVTLAHPHTLTGWSLTLAHFFPTSKRIVLVAGRPGTHTHTLVKCRLVDQHKQKRSVSFFFFIATQVHCGRENDAMVGKRKSSVKKKIEWEHGGQRERNVLDVEQGAAFVLKKDLVKFWPKKNFFLKF